MPQTSDSTLVCETNVAWPFWFKYGDGAGTIDVLSNDMRWWTPAKDHFGNYILDKPLRSTRISLLLDGSVPVSVPDKKPAEWPDNWSKWENAGVESWDNARALADHWFAWWDQAMGSQPKTAHGSAGRAQSRNSVWNRYYPRARIDVDEIPKLGDWGRELNHDDWLVNLDNRVVAEAFSRRIVDDALDFHQRWGVRRIMGDNLGHPSTGIGITWPATCDHLARIVRGLEPFGMTYWPNISGAIEVTYSEDDIKRLVATGIEGMNTEMMGHNAYRDLWDAPIDGMRSYEEHPIYQGIKTIRKMLDAGLKISVQAVSNSERDGTPIDRDQFARFMAGHIMLIRNPGDGIWLSRSWWMPDLADSDGDEVAYWPALLGAPKSDAVLLPSSDLGAQWARSFEHGYVTVNYRTEEAEVTLR